MLFAYLLTIEDNNNNNIDNVIIKMRCITIWNNFIL